MSLTQMYQVYAYTHPHHPITKEHVLHRDERE